METLDETRRRLAREQEEREKRMKDLEAQRNSKDNFGDIPKIYCMKIAEICEIAPVKEYTI